MKFECGDLERALAVPELMGEAREHLKTCSACRREYRLWNEISSAATELHQDWESADLWPKIRQALEAEPKPKPPWWADWKAGDWKVWSLAATVFLAAILLAWALQGSLGRKGQSERQQAEAQSTDRGFLTEQALKEVETNEAAYRRSIDKLSELALPKLHNSASLVATNYKEKLLMLDSAISETRVNLDQNRFNVHLQAELADLYKAKQKTLQELLTSDQKN